MPERRFKATEYTVGWICALPIELAAAQEVLDERHGSPLDNVFDSNSYTLGRIGSHNIVLACLPAGQPGLSPAAAVAARMLLTFKSIRYGLMVGVGGGVPSAVADIRLGDVVISQPFKQHGGVVQYDAGKTGRGGSITRTSFLNTPPILLLNAVSQLRANHYRRCNNFIEGLSIFERLPQFRRDAAGPDLLFEAAYNHSEGMTCAQCSKDKLVTRTTRSAEDQVTIHYGTIASGNQVMKDGITRDRLSEELGGVLCFEMEAAGLMNNFPCLVVRGICDYADSHKNKTWQPYAAATAVVCAKEILLLVPAFEGSTAETVAAPQNYEIPFSLEGLPVGKFADRPQDMEAIESVLFPQKRTEGRRTLVMHGLGGMGKTQLAVAFVRRHRKRFSSILWLDGSSKTSLKQSIAVFANRVPKGQILKTSRMYVASDGGDVDKVVKGMLSWLSNERNSDWLMVVDNVDRDYRRSDEDDEAYDVSAYLPQVDHGSVLITTRLPQLGQLGDMWEVRKVDEERAHAIFESWYGKAISSGHESVELLRLLDGLPLALAQAAAYMSETGMNFQTYTRLYNEQWKELMETEDGRFMPLRNYANEGVATTWLISYKAVRLRSEAAANLLLLWAHLDNKTLWWELLATASSRSARLAKSISLLLKSMAEREVEFIAAIRTLRNYSLVSCTEQGVYATHPVVHQWALHIQGKDQRTELSCLAIIIVGMAVPRKNETWFWESTRRLLPHAEHCRKMLEDVMLDEELESTDAFLYAVQKLGNLYAYQGKLVEAEQMFYRALQGFQKARGPDHTATLDAVNNLGILYADQGKLVEAEKMFYRALQGFKKTRGPDHTATLDAINNLGILYADQGKLVEAEKMYQQAIQGTEKARGLDHTETLDTLNNLGVLYTKQGKLVEAEQMYQQALEGYEKILGVHHTSTVETVNNLGLLYARQGKFVEAEQIFHRALQGFTKAWGPEHKSTLEAICNIGSLYANQGKVVEAEQMYQRALQGYERAIDSKSAMAYVPLLNIKRNLASLSKRQHRVCDARRWYSEALVGYEQALGINHSISQSIRYNIAALDEERDQSSN